MSYVFDASSIYTLIKKGMMAALRGNFTTRLASFELGNAVWKDVVLLKKITREDGLNLMAFVARVLNSMVVVDVDSVEVLKVATDYKVTFYDASYVWLAQELELPLVTEDNKLRAAVGDKIRVMSAADIVASP